MLASEGFSDSRAGAAAYASEQAHLSRCLSKKFSEMWSLADGVEWFPVDEGRDFDTEIRVIFAEESDEEDDNQVLENIGHDDM